MRTGLFLLSGFLFLAASLIVGKLFSANYPGGTAVATVLFVALWLVIAAPTCGLVLLRPATRLPKSFLYLR